jgi:hypothetical protein
MVSSIAGHPKLPFTQKKKNLPDIPKINFDGCFLYKEKTGAWGFVVRYYHVQAVLAGVGNLPMVYDALCQWRRTFMARCGQYHTLTFHKYTTYLYIHLPYFVRFCWIIYAKIYYLPHLKFNLCSATKIYYLPHLKFNLCSATALC